jgi:hypothetical protein
MNKLFYVVASESEDKPGFKVHAVLTNSDWAENLAKATEGDVYTFALDNIPDEIKEGKQFWNAQFGDWRTDKGDPWLTMLDPIDNEQEEEAFGDNPDNLWVEFTFWANGEREAKKIARQKLAEFAKKMEESQ